MPEESSPAARQRKPPVSVTFPLLGQTPDKQLEEGFILAHGSRGHSSSWRGRGSCPSTSSRETERGECWCSARLPLPLRPGLQSDGESSHFNEPSLGTLSQTCAETDLLGNSRSCQVDHQNERTHHSISDFSTSKICSQINPFCCKAPHLRNIAIATPRIFIC